MGGTKSETAPDTSGQDRLESRARAARSPRSAGVAGILFAVLFTISVTVLYVSVGGVGQDTGAWLAERSGLVSFGIGLMPFAGIFFLWFIGVVRARLGRFEDQFFSTVFMGSGLIFLALVFVAMSIAGAVLVGYARDPNGFVDSPTYYFARDAFRQVFSIYALRMAAVFLLSQGTLWLRTRVMPRWLIVITYLVSLLLLFAFSKSFWVLLVFPAWVFLVSSYVLIVSFVFETRGPGDDPAQAPGIPAA
jgi:hypothetical protein